MPASPKASPVPFSVPPATSSAMNSESTPATVGMSKSSVFDFVSKPIASVLSPKVLNDKVQEIASRYDDTELQSGIGDANHWKTDVSKDFPFSDTAKDLINKKVNYTYNRDLSAKSEVAGRTGTVNDGQYEVQLGKDTTDKTAKYETFHALFAHSKIDPEAFNAAWDKAKAGPDNTNNEIGAFDDHFSQYPNTFKSQGGPEGAENVDKDPYSLATERFASLGLAYGSEGLSAIPKDLQPFYKQYIADIPTEDSLNKEADELDAMKKTIDPQSQASIDAFNARVDKFNDDIKTYNSLPKKLSDADTKDIISKGGSVIGPNNGGLSYDQLPAGEKAKIQANILFPTELTPEQQKNNINIKIPFTASRYASIPAPATAGESGVSGSSNPLISFVANLPSTILQAIPRMLITLSEERKSMGTESTKTLGPIESRLYGEPEYKNINADIQARIARGDGALSAYIGAISSKVADVAIGAQVAAQGFRAVAGILSANDDVAHIEAWKTLGSPQNSVEAAQNYRALAHQFHPDLNPGISDDTIKVLNKAKSILDEKGIPTKANTSAQTASKYFEVLGRETNLGQPFKDANIATKETQGKDLGAKRLPGSAPVEGQAQPIGLSTQEVERVGGEEPAANNPEKTPTQASFNENPSKVPQNASDIVGNGSDLNAIEANTAKYIEANKDSLVSDYKAKYGDVFNVDNMKELIPGHAENRTISEAFHKPAAELMGKMIETAIDKNAGTGKNVVFLAGSPAAGKSTAIENLSNHDEYLAHAGVVVDGTLADVNRATDLIRKAIDSNQPVQIFYVENTPDRIADNLIRRAQSGGRTVPIETTFNAFQKSRQSIHRLAAKFASAGKNFNITVVDNSGETPKIVDNGVGFIRNKVYSADDIQRAKEAAYHKVTNLYNEGEITKKVLDGFIRRKGPANAAEEVRSKNGQLHGEESDKGVSEGKEKGEQKSPLDQKVDELKARLDIAKEALQNNPAKGLLKYANFKTGELPEVLGEGGKFGKTGDQLASELGFKSSEEAREAYQKYLNQRTKAVVLEQQYKGLKDLQKDEKLHQEAIDSANRFLEKSNGAMGKSVEAVAKAKMKERLSKMAEEARKRRETAHSNLRALEQVLDRETPALDQETLSIEAQAFQAANIEYSQLPSLHKIVIDVSTPVKQKVGILDYFRTPDRVLQKIGLGKNADEIRTGYENYLSELPQHINLIREWTDRVLKHSGSDTKVFQYLDGELKKSWDPKSKSMKYDMTPEEYLVAQEIKAYLEDWAYRLGLPEDEQVTHYITHIFEDQIVKKEFDEDLAKIIENKVPGSVYDPFLEKRLGMKGYVQSARRALEAYVKRAVRKANMDPALEHLKTAVGGDLKHVEGSRLESSQFKYVKRYADHVNLRPGEIENLIDNTTKQLVGYRFGQRPVMRAAKAMRMAVYRGMLGLNFGSAMRNLTQGVNTYAKLGEKYTTIGYTKLLTNMGSKELTESGVLNEDIIQDKSLSASKRFLQKFDKGLFIFFETAEKINRGAAYWGAKAKAMDKGMDEEAAKQYAKKIVRDTQFSFGTIDTPAVLRGEIMKTLLQFGSYSLKQTEFLTEMASKREWAGILRYILASTLIVYTIGKIFNIKADNFIPTNFFLKFGAPPTLQLPLAIIQALLPNQVDRYGKPMDWAQKGWSIANAAVPLIPGGVQGQKIYQGSQAVKSGKVESGGANAARAMVIGKSSVPKSSGNAANDILKKYGIGARASNPATAILKKYGIK